MPAGKIGRAGEGLPDVLPALFPRQAGLRCGVADPLAGIGQQRNVELPRQRTRQFQRLVEAALVKTCRMQWHRQQAVRQDLDLRQQGSGQTVCQYQLLPELERLHQLVERKSVSEGGDGAVERRRALQAAAADLAVRCGLCAQWATFGRQIRQGGIAGIAPGTAGTVSTAKHTWLRGQALLKLCADVQNPCR